MRISVEKAVFQQLLQVCSHQKPVNFNARDPPSAQTFDVDNLSSSNKLERQHPFARMSPKDLRNTHGAPRTEVVTKSIGVAPFLHVIHLFKDRRMKLAQHSFPIGVFIGFGKEPIGQLHKSVQNSYVETDDCFEVQSLHLDSYFLS